MMISTIIMPVTMPGAAISATFGLERRLQLYKVRSKAVEHSLNYMVGTNAKDIISNFRREVPISQVPSDTHKLIGICVPDFDNKLCGSLNTEQPPIIELQGISIGHCHRFWKVEKKIFAVISSEANAAAMACVKIQSDSARRLFLRPMSGGAVN
jgi:hypothetical protein